MKNFLFLILIVVTTLTSCNKQEKGISNERIITVTSPYGDHLITNYSILFTAKDGNGTDLTGQVNFFVNAQVQSSNEIIFTQSGNYEITAQLDIDGQNITSQVFNVQVTEPRHTTKILVEDYTGTWCPNCPRVVYHLKQAVQQNNNIIPVAIHFSRWQGDDPFGFDNINTLIQDFNINAFPTPVINRTLGFFWDETYAQLENELNKTQALGLAINSNVNANNLNIEVNVRFDLNLTEPDLKLVVLLLENELLADQVNSTSYYGGQNPIIDFEHNHTLRMALTGLYGETIPVDKKMYNQIYTYTFNGTIPANVVDIQNCEIVAFVIDESNHPGPLINIQSAPLGSFQNFD